MAPVIMETINRELIGAGIIYWDDVFRGIRDAEYDWPLMMEPFTSFNPAFTAVFKTRRPLKNTPDELGRKGLGY